MKLGEIIDDQVEGNDGTPVTAYQLNGIERLHVESQDITRMLQSVDRVRNVLLRQENNINTSW